MTWCPWVWDEDRVNDPEWANAKTCPDCHLQYMCRDEVHREECPR